MERLYQMMRPNCYGDCYKLSTGKLSYKLDISSEQDAHTTRISSLLTLISMPNSLVFLGQKSILSFLFRAIFLQNGTNSED